MDINFARFNSAIKCSIFKVEMLRYPFPLPYTDSDTWA